ncbi:M23 family metallopeptidase [Streptomyces sp. CBMA156]|uniref:M23 family metallopeptidase n=1 Tax=Streptomyces sp. CBMA156 TaxID=1930280 RepID=UPI0029500454|nr:M23 family metallopeptidase [Streptomyces sp. CBMA156]
MLKARLTGAAAIATVALSLLSVPSAHAVGRPNFQLPVPCGEKWTASTYAGHNPNGSVDLNHYPGDDFGLPVAASADGTVEVAEAGSSWAGTHVRINHGGGWTTHYAHLSALDVSAGTYVKAGQIVGRVGSTGNSTGPHLHFEETLNGVGQQATFDGVAFNGATQDFTSKNCGPAKRPTNVGVYRSAEALFAVADHGGGVAGSTMFGNPGDVPLVGDWNGDGKDTFGVYRPSEGWFYLSNDNASVAVSAGFGNPGDVPLVGDWNGDGRDTIGIYRPSTQDFVWTDDNVNVVRTQQMGSAGDVPVVGDWNGDGRDTIGVYRPAEGMFYLTDSGAGASVDHAVPFGNHYENPIVGDWDGDGRDEVGVYRSATAEFLGAAHDSSTLAYQVSFGNPGDTPITGTW